MRPSLPIRFEKIILYVEDMARAAAGVLVARGRDPEGSPFSLDAAVS